MATMRTRTRVENVVLSATLPEKLKAAVFTEAIAIHHALSLRLEKVPEQAITPLERQSIKLIYTALNEGAKHFAASVDGGLKRRTEDDYMEILTSLSRINSAKSSLLQIARDREEQIKKDATSLNEHAVIIKDIVKAVAKQLNLLEDFVARVERIKRPGSRLKHPSERRLNIKKASSALLKLDNAA